MGVTSVVLIDVAVCNKTCCIVLLKFCQMLLFVAYHNKKKNYRYFDPKSFSGTEQNLKDGVM